MKCMKCETEMTKSRLTSGLGYVYAMNRGKGLVATEKRSSITCWVCSKCGYIELNADEPHNIKID